MGRRAHALVTGWSMSVFIAGQSDGGGELLEGLKRLLVG